MILNDKERKEFEEAARPLMKFMGDNLHPHTIVVLHSANAQLFEGVCSFNTEEYIRD
jgi:hypothetical protein